MTTTVKYTGTLDPYFELAVTGKSTKWTPGRTADVSDVDAALLLATGLFEVYADQMLPFVFNASGAIVGVRKTDGSILAIGSGSGGGGGGAGGSDRTAVTLQADLVNGGQRVWKYTEDGIEWTIGYDAWGRPILYEAFSGVLARTVVYDGSGFSTTTGNVYVNGGEVRVPSTSMPALKASLAAQGTEVSLRFYVPEYRTAFSWSHNELRFFPSNGGWVTVVLNTSKPVLNPIQDGVESVALITGSLPGWMRGQGGALRHFVKWGFNTTNSTTKTVRLKLNGALWNGQTTTAGTNHVYQHDGVMDFDNDTTGLHFPTTASQASGASGNSPRPTAARPTRPRQTCR